jgi:hypothetical protein
VLAASALIAIEIGAASTSALAGPAAAPRAAPASFLGPLLSRAETTQITWGRDGGFSVPLPGGKDFFVFGDTPQYTYKSGSWKLTAFITGSSAGMVAFSPGKKPSQPFTEVIPRRALSPANKPGQFMATPRTYLLDGSGKVCNKANGGFSSESVRWATGAALMPDKTNILISYLSVCVISSSNFRAQGWGFAEFNWKTRKFTVPPVDVFPAARSGAQLPLAQFRGSPIIANGKVTFYASTCCNSGSKVYTTTLAAKGATLKKRGAYTSKVLSGVPPASLMHVAPKSSTQHHLTMYQMTGAKGQYRLLTASVPVGPWKYVKSGSLPRCGSTPVMCNSVAIHPELSTASRLFVSYYVPGYGPGIPKKHPYPHAPLGHVVMASLPL